MGCKSNTKKDPGHAVKMDDREAERAKAAAEEKLTRELARERLGAGPGDVLVETDSGDEYVP